MASFSFEFKPKPTKIMFLKREKREIHKLKFGQIIPSRLSDEKKVTFVNELDGLIQSA